MTGVETDICVELTVRDIYQIDYCVTTISDITGTYTKVDYLAALHALQLFSSTMSTAKVIDALQKLKK